ncbi:MAG: hypothetical protein AAF432_09820 [Planctomycetota bacterium]
MSGLPQWQVFYFEGQFKRDAPPPVPYDVIHRQSWTTSYGYELTQDELLLLARDVFQFVESVFVGRSVDQPRAQRDSWLKPRRRAKYFVVRCFEWDWTVDSPSSQIQTELEQHMPNLRWLRKPSLK